MQMLETDILPCFERMKREKEQYLEWQQACSNAEQLGHIVSAYRYWKLGKLLEEEKELHKARIQELKGLEADREAYEVRVPLLWHFPARLVWQAGNRTKNLHPWWCPKMLCWRVRRSSSTMVRACAFSLFGL
jgi:hypothetical protein